MLDPGRLQSYSPPSLAPGGVQEVLLERGAGGAKANPSQRACGAAAVHRHGQGFSHGSLTVWSGDTEERCTRMNKRPQSALEGEGSEENGPRCCGGESWGSSVWDRMVREGPNGDQGGPAIHWAVAKAPTREEADGETAGLPSAIYLFYHSLSSVFAFHLVDQDGAYYVTGI